MIKRPTCPDPPRLVSGEDRAGRLLRQADQAFRQGLAPGPAWKRFQSRRQQRRALSLAALALTGGFIAFMAHREFTGAEVVGSALSVKAEHFPMRATIPPAVQLPVQPPEPQRRISPPEPTRVRPVVARVAKRVAPTPEAPLSDTTCHALSNQAHFEQAVDCFQSISQGPGIGSEVALYEAARIAQENLLDAQRALSLLDQHSRRFPNSALRVEVAWLRVRSLEHAGRLDEALSASEALLDSAAGRALASKLHLLRGRIYSGPQQDCDRALREYVALLGEPGAAGDEAELRRAQCLESLGRVGDARAAYQRYLTRTGPRAATLARQRLQALGAPQLVSGGEL